MTDAFEAEIDTYDGLDIERIQRENLQFAGSKIQVEWRDNMRDAGYNNTGKAIADVTFEIEGDTVTIGGDVIQLIIGEFGRRPGSFPNVDDLGEWVNEQTGMPNKGDEDFDSAVYLVGRAIQERGLPEYAFGRNAFADSLPEIEKDLERRINRAIEQAEQ